MANLFDNYEEEFNTIKLEIEQNAHNIPSLEGEEKTAALHKAELDLKSLDSQLRQMSMSARGNPKQTGKMKEYEAELTRLRSTVRKSSMEVSRTNDRTDLFSGYRTEDLISGSKSQRERLIATNERAEKGSYELKEAEREVNETIGVGIQILEDLDKQGDQLRRQKQEVGEIGELLGKANRMMRSIARRAWRNKLILIIIALVLLAAICLIIYIRWFYKSSNSNDNNSTTGNSTTSAITSGYLTSGMGTTATTTMGTPH